MNITQEQQGNLSTVVKITLEKDDYQPRLEKALKDYRRRVNLPGFRQGQVPMGIIKKRFGKSLLADEINGMLNETLNGYINEQKLRVLGSPIPSENREEVANWDEPDRFEFFYDVALAPEFSVEIGPKTTFTYTKVGVSDKMIDEEMDNLRRRHGKLVDAEISSDKDMLLGDFVELDANDEIVEGGIMNRSTISIEFVKDEDTQKKLVGLKAEDHAVIDPRKVSTDERDLARMLGLEEGNTGHIQHNFRFNVKEIKSLEKAELNQELFNKVFGEGMVTSEEEMRAKLGEEFARMYAADCERLFKREIMKQLDDNLKIELPDELLKRFIMLTNEKPVTPEQLELEYPQYSRGLRWQLIENKLLSELEVKVEHDEVLEYVKGLIANNFKQYGIDVPEDEELKELAVNAMKKRDDLQKLYDDMYERKLLTAIREKAKIKEQELSFEEFVAFAQRG